MSARKSYLFSKLTGDIIETYEPDSFMGSSNRFSDGEPVYIKLTPTERKHIAAHPQRNRYDHLTWLHYHREGKAAKKMKARNNRKASITGSKNPIGKTGNLAIRWVIRAHHENGKLYYFTGQKLDSEKRLAKKFFAARDVEQNIKWLEKRLPPTIKFVDAVTT